MYASTVALRSLSLLAGAPVPAINQSCWLSLIFAMQPSFSTPLRNESGIVAALAAAARLSSLGGLCHLQPARALAGPEGDVVLQCAYLCVFMGMVIYLFRRASANRKLP